MEKYTSFEILSVTAKVMIFSWFLQESNELFFILFVHATLKWSLWFLHCIHIAYPYAIFAKLQTKVKKQHLAKVYLSVRYVYIFLLSMS